MESNAERAYVRNLANVCQKKGLDVLVPDHRSCGDVFNKLYRSYHSGNSADLREILNHASEQYNKVFLIGFSLGGNIVLKYLGEQDVNNKISKAFCISTPLDLSYSSTLLEKTENTVYRKRFVKKLKYRLLKKAEQFPDKLMKSDISKAFTIKDIDDLYTSKAHGFKDAEEYYRINSSKNFIHNIEVETHLFNAQNDPMIFLRTFEIEQLQSNTAIHLHLQEEGGHVGFPSSLFEKYNFYEKAILHLI